MFPEAVLDHFQSPRNVGEMVDADREAEGENPVCGDRLHLWLRLEGDRIAAASWKADGCVPAIAAASVMSEAVRGLTLDEARNLDPAFLAAALGGLPARKAHAVQLAVSTLRAALVPPAILKQRDGGHEP